jgi:hypothetical protein
MKYEVRIEGHMETRKAFSALLEVEADSEGEANRKARMTTGIPWTERYEDYTSDMGIVLDSAEVISKIEES